MSYAYLFKYIIIGDTGKCATLMKMLLYLRLWINEIILSYFIYFWSINVTKYLFQVSESRVYCYSLQTNAFSRFMISPLVSRLIVLFINLLLYYLLLFFVRNQNQGSVAIRILRNRYQGLWGIFP